MADAPSTAYYKNALAKLPLHIPGVIKYDAFPAINTYGTLDQVKALFFLDYVLQVAHKEAGVLQYSFIGAVIVGGANEAYHAAARKFKASVPVKIGGVIRNVYLLNDAGLNTKGKVTVPVVVNRQNTQIRFQGRWYSAFYHPTSNYGFEFYTLGDVPKNGTISIGTIAAAGSDETDLNHLVQTDLTGTNPGDQLYFRSFIVNQEGTKYSDWYSAILVRPVAVKRAATGPEYASCNLSPEIQEFTVYTTAITLAVGEFIFQDEARTTPALNGSYRYASLTGFNYFFIVDGAIVTDKRCPEYCIVSMWVEMVNQGGSLYHFYVNIEPDIQPNTSMIITGSVQIFLPNSSWVIKTFEVELLAMTGIQTFLLTENIDDPVAINDPQSAQVVAATLQYDYYESDLREVVYTKQLS
ncbi:hypothetical protein ACFSJU_14740 [Paradesertivirga mongoliensis]|uniref:Uncharacterized protein n=1 Tax=Paradesertivirga mongoliensis TaxID=2100740 RepID=A0ABW4ZP51_9SPHI|nr:hypothetical protein [Pedobacter mongoliensis]